MPNVTEISSCESFKEHVIATALTPDMVQYSASSDHDTSPLGLYRSRGDLVNQYQRGGWKSTD